MEMTKIVNQSSVEVNKNSKGYTYSIKAYGDDADKIEKNLKKLTGIAQNEIVNLEIQEELKK